jgi:homoserine dehydrogenase
MSEPLSLGVAGLGTVGAGLIQLLKSHEERLGEMLGRSIKIAGVSARSNERVKELGLESAKWFDDPIKLAVDPSIDVFVELMGGEDGVAKASVEAALKAKKHVVTANKALLAKHGLALAKLAEQNGVALNFEAAVAGGIPIIKMLREALAANEVKRVYGILNGTCNFILTKMQEESRPFAEVLKEAQDKGYAEADPTFDIGGFDAAHKLALLTSLAFGATVDFEQVYVEGIESITAADIEAADSLGYRIKLLGVAERTTAGIEARVTPVLIEKDTALAEIDGVTNCIGIDGDFVGNLLVAGPGAGSKPTASAVASDIIDIGRGLILPPFLRPTASLKPFKRVKVAAHHGSYYVRLSVLDRPGAMAAIAKRMGDQGVSLESIVQRRMTPGHSGADGHAHGGEHEATATVVLETHETTEDAMRKALNAIEKDGKVSERPQVIRIEEFLPQR